MLSGQVKQARDRDAPITGEAPPGFGLLPRIEPVALATPAVPEIPRPGLPGTVERHAQHEPGLIVRIAIGDTGQGSRHTDAVRRGVHAARHRSGRWGWRRHHVGHRLAIDVEMGQQGSVEGSVDSHGEGEASTPVRAAGASRLWPTSRRVYVPFPNYSNFIGGLRNVGDMRR